MIRVSYFFVLILIFSNFIKKLIINLRLLIQLHFKLFYLSL